MWVISEDRTRMIKADVLYFPETLHGVFVDEVKVCNSCGKVRERLQEVISQYINEYGGDNLTIDFSKIGRFSLNNIEGIISVIKGVK